MILSVSKDNTCLLEQTNEHENMVVIEVQSSRI